MKRLSWVLLVSSMWLGCGSSGRDPNPVAPAPTVAVPAPATAEAPTSPAPPVAPPPVTAAPAAPNEADEAADKALVAQALTVIEKGREAWYGVYIMGKKAGHGRITFRAATPEEAKQGASVVFEMDMQMDVNGGGNANTIRVAEQRYYGASWPYALVSSRFQQTSNGYDEARVGIADPAGMRITRTINGKVEPARVGPVTHEHLVDQIVTTPFDLDHVAIGKPRDVVSWTWEQEADEAMTVTVERVETRKRAGIDEQVAVVAMKYLRTGVNATSTVASQGELLEMTLGAAINLKLEEHDVAISGVSGLDVMGSGIKSPTPLGDPSVIERATYELTVAPGVTLPSSAAQRVATTAPNKLTITRTRGPGDAATPEAMAAALKPDATMDSDEATIQAKAAELTAGKSDAQAKVHSILRFVYDTLDKKLATHLPTASKVLEQKVGDCTEHTWLTTALLRAAGIPARPVYGVAYAGDREQSFAYHAWVEVALDGKWLWIDPTWNEDVSDATHLGLGDDLGAVAPSLGGVTIDHVTR